MIHSPTDASTAQSEPHAAPQTEPTNPIRALQTIWPVGLAGLPAPQLVHERRIQTADR